jgi:3-oxoacyl-[acyl-carrier-protein] synthase-1
MMSQKSAVILAIGMITPVGIGAKQTAASIRAGISRFSETSIYDKWFEPLVMSVLPDDVLPPQAEELRKIPSLTTRQTRMLKLATPAIQEALENVPNTEEIPLYLGVPESLPQRPEALDDIFIEHLVTQAGVGLNIATSKICPQGRAAGLVALKEAIDSLASGKVQFAVVGGVDTYLDLYLLGTLDMEGRILGPNTMDGFVPGEGAGFLLLGSPDKSSDLGIEPIAKIQAVDIGHEGGHYYSEEVYRGDGLAEAFQATFSYYDGSTGKIRTVYAGLNGENFGAKEWGVAYMRSKTHFEDDFRLEHPADCFGDPGAALGPLMAGLAAIGLANKTIAGPCLVWCSSDFGTRAALILGAL